MFVLGFFFKAEQIANMRRWEKLAVTAAARCIA